MCSACYFSINSIDFRCCLTALRTFSSHLTICDIIDNTMTSCSWHNICFYIVCLCAVSLWTDHRWWRWQPGGSTVYGSGQSAQQVCRQGDTHPVLALLPSRVKLICCALASPLLGTSYLQVLVLFKGLTESFHCKNWTQHLSDPDVISLVAQTL